MADLSTEPTTSSPCCSTEAQATCCEPFEKDSCCGTSAAGGSCGCSAGASDDIRESVRERYAAAARSVAEQSASSSCCGSVALAEADEAGLFGVTLYAGAETEGAPDGRSPRLWAAGCRPRSRIFIRARPSWTSARAPARTYSSAPSASPRAAARSGLT